MFLDSKETKQLNKAAHALRLVTFVREIPGYNLDHGLMFLCLFLPCRHTELYPEALRCSFDLPPEAII